MQSFGLPIILLVVFYFLIIAPQKKKEKKIREMRAALKEGDQIVTIGGIMGKIVSVKEDVVTVEVGSDKVKLKFAKWAVGSVVGKDE
ncbi:MAG: preprotein translocase subunit YajC [Clostridiales bacterium]|nr:preprotein translocase subunit YajC [Clostridiales bacterium]